MKMPQRIPRNVAEVVAYFALREPEQRYVKVKFGYLSV